MTLPRLMLVTDRHRVRRPDLVAVIAEAVQGGVDLVQIREKDLPHAALVDLVRRVHERVPPETLVVVNGRPRVARLTGCGLHLPAALEMPERKGLPVVGRSVHDVGQARRGIDERVDYLVQGPIYPTASKPGHPGSGLDLLREIATLAAPLPIFAIGGIQVSKVPEVVRAGAWGVAVSGAILSSSEPARAAQALRLAIEVATGEHRSGQGRRGP